MKTEEARQIIARRAAQDLVPGEVVNLGVGIPLDVLDFVPPTLGIILHSENGLLGMGPPAPLGEQDRDLTNAGAVPVTMVPGASVFDVVLSAALMRGGHLDQVFMGAFQVDQSGNLANWRLSHREIKGGIGGAMDLAVGARSLTVLMTHTTRDGRPRLVEECDMPLTAVHVVKRIITELAVIDVTPQGFVLRELLGEAGLDDVRSKTDAKLADERPTDQG